MKGDGPRGGTGRGTPHRVKGDVVVDVGGLPGSHGVDATGGEHGARLHGAKDTRHGDVAAGGAGQGTGAVRLFFLCLGLLVVPQLFDGTVHDGEPAVGVAVVVHVGGLAWLPTNEHQL